MIEWNDFEKPTPEQRIESIRRSVSNADELKKLIRETPEGFRLNSFYTSSDPGLTGGRFLHRDWEIRQVIYTDKIMAANQSAIKALENGASSIVFRGNDVPSENEMNALFKGIRPDWVPVYFDLGESSSSFMYLLLEFYRENGYDTSSMQGGIYYDPLGDMYLQGGYNHSESETFLLLKELVKTGGTELPGYKMIAANTHYLRDAGAGAGLEVAVGLSQFTEYVHHLTDAGLGLKEVLSTLAWNTGIGSDYFMEIAKYRVINTLLKRWLSAFGAEEIQIPVNAITGIRNKTLFDVHNNMLRNTSEAMAAAIGGAGAITVMPHNDVAELPDEFAYRQSRNLQLLLKEESLLDKVADPSAGSYYIETITDKLMQSAWDQFLEFEKEGGYVSALQKKIIQQRAELSSNAEKKDFTEQKKILVGSNKYANARETIHKGTKRDSYLPFLKNQVSVMPVQVERLSEKLEAERLKLMSEKAENEN